MNTSNTIGNVRIASLFIALGLTIAVNGSTLALFDSLAHANETAAAPATATVALETVTITAKRI